MRKLASIQKILSLTNIPNAEKIECAKVLGWNVVVEKWKYEIGDLVVYCEVDSLLPEKPEFEFLRKNHFRIRTIRLRGQISQGICFPLSILPMGTSINEGDDITEVLGVTQYIAPVPTCLSGVAKGLFPSFIPKTDEERIQTCPDALQRHRGKEFYISEKLDGSSCTMFLKHGEFGVCSRNLELLEAEGNTLWKVARELDIENKLRKFGRNLALQGEVIGNGIQGNKYKLNGVEWRIFSIFDIDSYKYLDFSEFLEVATVLGLATVPIVEHRHILEEDVEALVRLSNASSFLNSNTIREGIVMRPLVEEVDSQLGRLSFKIINPEFLLANNE